eukprot:TRINITY_DN66958_c0_g2_i4.p2 TRINITY_DN66958_c0_g2~~TRINITY_DN66958_c0_g2_i4.p2  ORF type:complete len:108 (-),score=15.73 TRINITY_DN66958_c0_g2_i4:1-324(-)
MMSGADDFPFSFSWLSCNDRRRPLVVGPLHDFVDELFIFDIALQILPCVCGLDQLVHISVRQLLAQSSQQMPELSGGDVALPFTVESLEGLVAVSYTHLTLPTIYSV